MRVLELLCEVARQQPHHTVKVEVDGYEAELVEVTPAGGGDALLTVELDDELTVLPLEADDDMLAAVLDEFAVPATLARNVWRAMAQAYVDAAAD